MVLSAGLYAPLATLRRRPRGPLRTARGRCGLLLLHRSGFAPPTPCRSPGALVPTKSILNAANVPIIGGHHVPALQGSPEGWQATSLLEPQRLRRDMRELIIAPRRQHSQKPDEAYDRIER